MGTRLPASAPSHTMRRDEPTRIEGFSDAVFGFSLTLLAFSLEVPSSIEELRLLAVAQLVPTLAAFSLMCWIWAEHNSFFRQFGLQDATTIVLNSALLFLVVFYTYPLKFMAVYLWMLIASGFGWTGIMSAIVNSGSLDAGTRAGRGDDFALMLIYNLGFIALFAIFALLYRHALRQRAALALDDVELFDARAGQRVHLISVGVGAAAIAVMLALPHYLAGMSGMVYMLMGPVHGVHGARSGRARARLLAARAVPAVSADPAEPADGPER
ncbi:MAG: TMEM175 family protein [Acidobacteriota bacterium]|nr:TMEM175 family protein [Acidobacteriota bacterium]